MNWLLKLSFDVVEVDEKLSITVTWDEKDPELADWTSWDNKLRSDFLSERLASKINSIRNAGRNELALDNQVVETMPEEIPSCGI